MQSKAPTVAKYLAELPPERRAAIQAVRETILANLDRRYEEGMHSGIIAYYVPHSVYPPGYHCDPKQPLPFAGLASQKNYMSVYLMSVYAHEGNERWLRDEFKKAGKKLDMGKCCIRFKKLDDLPLAVIGEAIRRVPVKTCIEHYETAILTMNKAAAARMAKKKAETRAAATPASASKGRTAKPTARKARAR